METENPLPLAVTYEEAARLLSCSRDMIRDLVDEGVLHKVKIKTLVRIRVSELQAFIEAGGTASNARYPGEAVA